MKVLHLISGGDVGGARTHIINLLSELQKSIDVKLICFMKEDFYYALKEDGINIEVYEQKKRYDFSVIKRLIKEIKTEKYDLIHCHGARANFIASILKFFCRVPIVTTIHSDYRLDFKDNFYKNIVYRSLNTASLKIIDYYIGVSDSFKDMMIDRGFNENKIFTFYNGIDMNHDPNVASKEDFLKKYNIKVNENTIIVGILARLHPVKGVDVLIRGAKLVLDQRKNVKFLIGGDGTEESMLKELVNSLGIEDDVYLLGFVNEQNDFLNTVDINTLTSYSESFPYAIMEGAVFKKPIVSSRVGGIGDLVVEDKTGLLFDAGDYQTLANQLLKLIDDSSLRERLGEELYNSVNKNYSAKSMADKHISIYKQILGRQVK